MKEIVISTDRITKTFSGKEVIRDCRISVERGTVYGFLGKNGAGKTTMFKLLLGFLKPTAGTGLFFPSCSILFWLVLWHFCRYGLDF